MSPCSLETHGGQVWCFDAGLNQHGWNWYCDCDNYGSTFTGYASYVEAVDAYATHVRGAHGSTERRE